MNVEEVINLAFVMISAATTRRELLLLLLVVVLFFEFLISDHCRVITVIIAIALGSLTISEASTFIGVFIGNDIWLLLLDGIEILLRLRL